MGLKDSLLKIVLIVWVFGCVHAETLMLEGRTTPIPAITQSVRALHLRAVGADRVYALHFPETLEALNLSANNLMLLPGDLIPGHLKHLWLSDNQLMSLPQEAGKWHRLTYLNLDRNRLAQLPDLSSTSLRWLRLNHNRLTHLPPLPETIERLYLADNLLRTFASKPKALRHLTLAGNPLETVAPDLGCGLEELDLSSTKITHLPENLTGWQSLRVLNLANCPLSSNEKDRIEAAFDPLKTLILF